MNINIIGSQLENYEYLDFISTVGFASFVNVFTRLLKGQQHSCIDHIIFVKSRNAYTFNEMNAGVLLMDITDHCSIVISIPLNDNLIVLENKMNVINYNTIKHVLNKKYGLVVYESNSLSYSYAAFLNTIKITLDVNILKC